MMRNFLLLLFSTLILRTPSTTTPSSSSSSDPPSLSFSSSSDPPSPSSSSLSHNYYKNNINVFDVVDYGAIGDGHTDDTQAFRSAWEAMCNCSSTPVPTMYVPSGKTFLLSPSTFKGSCSSKNLQVMINGTIVAPEHIDKWMCQGNDTCQEWIKFTDVDGLDIIGSGSIDGRGSNWWNGAICKQKQNACSRKPMALKIWRSDNVHIRDLTFLNSPRVHIFIFASTRVYISNVSIYAPGNSPNTDGIDIQRSTNISIDQTHIGTGDDCIAIGSGSSHINVDQVTCGPGHGISIGSLGKNGQEATVEHVYVRNIEFQGTSNGARIKTWQGGKGYARDILFEHIRCTDTQHPIIIDQYYCDPHKICNNQSSAVHISNVRFNHVYGTTNKDTAVRLACSAAVPCTDISLNDIRINSTGRHKRKASSYCLNVQGKVRGEIVPWIPCLGY